jgi:hypothetical protein
MTLTPRHLRTLAFATIALTATFGFTNAQQPAPAAKEYQPTRGQQGKDVIWIPSPEALVERMLDMAKVGPNDTLIDLGSGDGRFIIAAAKRGIKALGIEYNPDLVQLSKRNAEQAGVSANASFIQGDIFQTDFSHATVLTMFLLQELNQRLRPIILDMKPGTRVLSNTFDMGEWKADETISSTKECVTYCTAFYWVVPAKVQGTWQSPQAEITLNQTFQMLSGSVKTPSGTAQITDGKMSGANIAFTAGGTAYTGTVNGNVMDVTAKASSGETKIQAKRG